MPLPNTLTDQDYGNVSHLRDDGVHSTATAIRAVVLQSSEGAPPEVETWEQMHPGTCSV